MNGTSGFTRRPYRYIPRLATTMRPATMPTLAPPSSTPSRAVTAAMPTADSAGHTRAATSVGPATENESAISQ
jgi:hypothetical protein